MLDMLFKQHFADGENLATCAVSPVGTTMIEVLESWLEGAHWIGAICQVLVVVILAGHVADVFADLRKRLRGTAPSSGSKDEASAGPE